MRAATLLLVIVAGCSGLRTYPTDPGGNLAVRSRMDSDVRAVLHVHQVERQCQTDYRGSVPLDRPLVSLALPAGQPAYLVVTFDTSSFLGGSRSTSAGALLVPRAGARYELSARYRDGIYDVALSESDGRAWRALPRREIDACRTRG